MIRRRRKREQSENQTRKTDRPHYSTYFFLAMSSTKDVPVVSAWQDRVTYRKPATKEDEDEVIDFVNEHFVPFEPLNEALNLCPPGYRYGNDPSSFRGHILNDLCLQDALV